jgi:energy-coupling factor transporter ATP-binding protein EcfA2
MPTRSRLALAQDAKRPSMKARLLLAGPSGSGKTRTGLELASILAGPGGKVLGVDTEDTSMLTYADHFDFEWQHLPWQEPYDNAELTDLIKEAGPKYDAILIDSLSHFWRGKGGILELSDARAGWKGARPVHDALVESIKHCACHIIVCSRMKESVSMEKDEVTGKTAVRKIGLTLQQDDNLGYEMNVSAEIDLNHNLFVVKSRSAAIQVGRTFAANDAARLGYEYSAWLEEGDPFAPLEVRAELDKAMKALQPAQKSWLWDRMKAASLPLPDLLIESQVDTLRGLIAEARGIRVGTVQAPVENSNGEATTPAEALRAAAERERAESPASPAEATA